MEKLVKKEPLESQQEYRKHIKELKDNLFQKKTSKGEYLPIGFASNFQNEYDVVIVAVGFGIEKKHTDVMFRSYWHLDTLAQPTIRGSWPRRWLVSGTGDGGMIDAIRLVLFEVDQENLTNLLLGEKINKESKENVFQDLYEAEFEGENWIKELKEFRSCLIDMFVFDNSDLQKLKKALTEIIKKINEEESKGINNLEKLKKERFDLEDEISEKFHEKFRECLEKKENEAVRRKLGIFLRQFRGTDTIVYLNGLTKEPYGFGPSLFHCLLIYLLRCDCGLRYRCGELDIPEKLNTSNTYRVLFKRKDRYNESPLEIDDIVIRQGAGPDIWCHIWYTGRKSSKAKFC